MSKNTLIHLELLDPYGTTVEVFHLAAKEAEEKAVEFIREQIRDGHGGSVEFRLPKEKARQVELAGPHPTHRTAKT